MSWRTVSLYTVAVFGFVLTSAAQVAKPAAKSSTQAVPSKVPAASDTDQDVNAISKYESQVRNMLYDHRFDQLDNISVDARKNRLKFKGGVWKLYVIFQALKQPAAGRMAEESDWDKHMAALGAWAQSNPNSDTARIALAEAALRYSAKMTNTPVDAAHTKDEIVARRNGSYHLAELMLTQAWALKSGNPHLYFVTIEIEERRNRPKAEALFEEAISLAPTYYPLYRLHALYQRQEWGGDNGDASKFASTIADRVGKDEGDIVYFEIASALDISPNVQLFPIAELSWDRIARGYHSANKTYGFSQTKLNQFAYLALRSHQYELAKDLFTRIGRNWDVDTWGSERFFGYASDYATAPREIIDLRNSTEIASSTPDGKSYEEQVQRDLGPQLMPFVGGCLEPDVKAPRAGFDMFFNIGDDGSVLETKTWPKNKFITCITPGLNTTKLHVSPPARNSHWVRMTDLPMPGWSN